MKKNGFPLHCNLIQKALSRRFSLINRKRNCSTGFTTTELLVGIAIFTVITTVMTGMFISIMRSQRAAQQIIGVNNNGGIVLEQIAREARTGYNFSVETASVDCGEDWGTQVSFVNGQNGKVTIYKLVSENGTITREEEGDDYPVEMTASNVFVKRLCFRAAKTDSDPVCNPERLSVVLEVASRNASSTPANASLLQTTVSSRVLPREIVGDPLECKR